jgi:hypothetical protein
LLAWTQLDGDVASVDVARVVQEVLPPPSLRPTSSSHLLLVLLFLCPVVVGYMADIDVAWLNWRG